MLKPPTMKDVAVYTKLSRGTVSKVINSTGKVRPETAARVKEAIETLGYRPNEIARSLLLQRTSTICMVLPPGYDPWQVECIQASQPLARNNGYRLLVYADDEIHRNQREFLESMLSWRVDAVMVGNYLDHSIVREFVRQGVVVLYGGMPVPELPEVYFTCVDFRLGMQRVANHLLQLGHRHIAMFGESEPEIPGSRAEMLGAALRNAVGDSASLEIIKTDGSIHAAAAAVPVLLNATGGRVTAVVCNNDASAQGLMSGLDSAGVRIPQDMSVVGINDMIASRYFRPPLTTLRIPSQDMAQQLTGRAVSILAGNSEAQVTLIAPDLVVRESTGVARRDSL